MYPYRYDVSNSSSPVYRSTDSFQNYSSSNYQSYPASYSSSYSSSYPYAAYSDGSDDRFFLAPFLVGGLAGTALGYGIANNNQINRPPCCMMVPMGGPGPMPYYPTYNTTFYN